MVDDRSSRTTGCVAGGAAPGPAPDGPCDPNAPAAHATPAPAAEHHEHQHYRDRPPAPTARLRLASLPGLRRPVSLVGHPAT